MENFKIMNETFSIQFSGEAFDNHDIPAAALAQSLLALDGLAKRVAEVVYGKESNTEIKVKAGFRKGSFIIDLVAQCQNDPVVAVGVAAGAATVVSTVGLGVVATIKGVIKAGKFFFGKKATVDPRAIKGDQIEVTNEIGQINNFNINVINIYNQDRTQSQLSRLTQTLDQDGVDSIRVYKDENDKESEVITKEDRKFFRHEEGIVLTDNEVEVILEVVGPMTNGASKGWKFSEGEDGIEFTANVEDEEFLQDVKSRKIKFENGTAIRAVVRTVQRKNIRTITDRTIVDVKEVFCNGGNLF